MGRFTQLRQDDITSLVAEFSLGALESWKSIEAGTINSNYRLTTEQGTFFLRVNEGKSLQEVEYEVEVLAHFAAHGVHTPQPRPSRTGQRHVLHKGKFVSVFAWLPGGHLNSQTIEAVHCRALGKTLAKLHEAGREADEALVRESRYSLARVHELFQSFAASSDPVLGEVIALLDAEFDWLHQQEDARAANERGLIHADLFPDNVLVQEGGIGALLDFEQACHGAFLYDLAVVINAWCFSEALVPDRLRALVQSYCQARSCELSAPALAVELRAAALRFTVTRVTDVYLPSAANGPDSQAKDFRRYAMRLRTWQEIEGLETLL